MGQAWCKERTKKAQDSKSPLDRVFVRCAHQIYPTLKQDGSVLGGATQRVTSSEIGYAGSPPREALTRGQSVDSIDRPFHPSEWVDVNLEVPSTPSSAITNLTANTSIYPTTMTTTTTTTTMTTTLSSTGSNTKSASTPVPPPRRRRKNRGRPLPPKPDDFPVTHKIGGSKSAEPLYSSVKSSRVKRGLEPSDNRENIDSGGGFEEESQVNGVPRTSAVTAATREDGSVSGKREETITEVARRRDVDADAEEDEVNRTESKIIAKSLDADYEKFSKRNEIAGFSTPKSDGRETDLRDLLARSIVGQDQVDDVAKAGCQRSKNYSTVSLPNYDELEGVKKEVSGNSEGQMQLDRAINASTNSLPGNETASRHPQGFIERLEQYMTRSRSFGSLRPREVIDELKAQGELVDSSDDDDDWGGLDDWDLGVIEYQEPGDGRSPLEPSSRLTEGKRTVKTNAVSTTEREKETSAAVVVNVSEELDPSRGEDKAVESEKPGIEVSVGRLSVVTGIPRNASFEIPKSPNSLKSAMKVQASRKYSVPAKLSSENSDNPLDDWFSAQERSVRFFDAPKLDEEFANTPGHRPARPSPGSCALKAEHDARSYPFNGLPTGPLDIDTFFESSEEFGGTRCSSDSHLRGKSLTRSLSNESEPFEGYEEKELTPYGEPPRWIPAESQTVSGDDPMRVKAKEVLDNVGSHVSPGSRTPPPSPEPKIRAEMSGSEYNLGGTRANVPQKMAKEDECGSNMSSMTPSLTELEAALSDMLEKEGDEREGEERVEDPKTVLDNRGEEIGAPDDDDDDDDDDDAGPIEPNILPRESQPKISEGEERVDVEKARGVREEGARISLGEILNDSSGHGISGKISSRDGGAAVAVAVAGSPNVPSRKLSPRRETASQITGGIFKGGDGGAKTRGKNPFEESEDEEERYEGDNAPTKRDYDESKRESDISKAPPRAGSHSANPLAEVEPPAKPSRLHRLPLDPGTESDDPDVPTPPQRRQKHAGVGPTIKTSPDNTDSQFPIADSKPHPNDRLI